MIVSRIGWVPPYAWADITQPDLTPVVRRAKRRANGRRIARTVNDRLYRARAARVLKLVDDLIRLHPEVVNHDR